MQKVVDFRRRTKDLRDQAVGAPAFVKPLYEELAAGWERLAADRLAFFAEHPQADVHGEAAEDRAKAPAA